MNVTNQLARLRVDIPALGWKIGDQVCIKKIEGEGSMRKATVEHATLGESLSNLSVDLLDFDEPSSTKIPTA